jgi:hypothetical protein
VRFREVLDAYELEIDHDFRNGELDRSVWFPHHLPQWSSLDASAARYEVDAAGLHLLIEPDQPPWCPEFDDETRVSSLQTGVFAGPLGSTVGQHRFRPEVVVREAQDNVALFTPLFGAFSLRARATADPDCMVALWMIGYEDQPERSAEICICEIFGRNVKDGHARIGMGVHPFGDRKIIDDFLEVPLDLDVTEAHEYAVAWSPDRVDFFVDDEQVRRVPQSPQYPMQFMLGIYQFGTGDDSRSPKRFTVERFQAYRPAIPESSEAGSG